MKSFAVVPVLAALALLGACSAPDDEEEGSSGSAVSTTAPAGFVCTCKATEPGVEDATGAKNCSYACACNVFEASGEQRKVPGVKIGPLKTTAASKEKWDFGSHICHGQHAWRPTPSSPNWQIEVKFSELQVTHYGNTFYPDETVETSTSMRESLKRTETAPEIRHALAKALGMVP